MLTALVYYGEFLDVLIEVQMTLHNFQTNTSSVCFEDRKDVPNIIQGA